MCDIVCAEYVLRQCVEGHTTTDWEESPWRQHKDKGGKAMGPSPVQMAMYGETPPLVETMHCSMRSSLRILNELLNVAKLAGGKQAVKEFAELLKISPTTRPLTYCAKRWVESGEGWSKPARVKMTC
jgi:hypothetical protein